MEEIKEYTKYFSKLILILILVSAVPLYLLNKGLYFSETNKSLQVEFTDSTENKIKELAPISKIDRDNSYIYFQNYSYDSIKEKIDSLVSENEDIESISYKEISNEAELQDVFSIILKISIGLLIGFVLLNAYRSYYRLEKKIDYYSFIRLTASIAAFQIAFLLGTVGVLGIVSRFYTVTIEDLYSIVVVESLVFILLNYLLNSTATLDFGEYKNTVRSWIEMNKKNTYFLLVAILFPLFFGLGINFILPALIIISFFGIAIALIKEMIQIEELVSERYSKINIQTRVSKKKLQKTKRGTKNWKNRFNKKRK